MKNLFFILILSMSTFVASAQTLVPFLKKTGKYIFVESGSMKPVINQEFDQTIYLPDIFVSEFEKVKLSGKDVYIDKKGTIYTPDDNGVAKDEKGNTINAKYPIRDDMQVESSIETNFEIFITDGWYGFKNKEGKIVVPCKYQDANNFFEGLALVKIDDTRKGYIDTTGKLIFSSNSFMDCKNFSEGLALIRNNTQIYFVNRKGVPILQFKEDDDTEDIIPNCPIITFKNRSGIALHSFHEGLAGVDLGPLKGEKWSRFCTFIDKSGKSVMPIKNYKYVSGFVNGYAILETESYSRFYIDKEGREYIEK